MSSTVRSSYWGPNTQFATKTFPEQRSMAEQRGWKVEGQEEVCPTTGRKHYQFWVKTPQVRMSEVKKIFAGAHIEVARNVAAVQQYCRKEETRSGALPQASDKYPNQDKLFKLFGEWVRFKLPMVRKHGVLYDQDGYTKTDVRGDIWLQWFDECCEALIIDGYRVESLAVNPAVRSAIKKFGNAIYSRYKNEVELELDENRCAGDRQTDRQPEKLSQSVVIPTIDASGRCKDTATEDESDAQTRTEESEDYEDCDGSADEGHTESTSVDGSEASDGTGDS